MSEISDTKTIVQILYKALSMWHCVSCIRTITQFQLNICIRVFAISTGFICEVVMNKVARTSAFSFQINRNLAWFDCKPLDLLYNRPDQERSQLLDYMWLTFISTYTENYTHD